MRRRRRGRKLTAAVAAEAIEASAGLRPDQAITEAAVGRVLRHRSAGGLAHPSVVRKMAASPSVHSANLAYRWAACVPIDPPRTTPNAVEIGTEKTPIIAATAWQRGQSSRSAIAPFPDAPSETSGQFTSGPSPRHNTVPSIAELPGRTAGVRHLGRRAVCGNEGRRLHFAGRYRSSCATFDADGRSGCETRTNAVMPTIRLPRTANA